MNSVNGYSFSKNLAEHGLKKKKKAVRNLDRLLPWMHSKNSL